MAASTDINFIRFLPKLKCLKCGDKVEIFKLSLRCQKCKTKISLPNKQIQIATNRSLGERVFDIPLLYSFKIRILNSLNKLKIPIDPVIKNKEILDLGCGSYQVRYSPSLAKLRIGIDPSSKALIKAQQLYPNSLHIVGSADKLPFKNKSFDVTLLLFTLHHLNLKQWGGCLKEVERVTKKKIVIYDHVMNNSSILKSLQFLYWKIFDGGYTYPQESEWQKKLKNYKIKRYLRVGSMFRHICFYELDLK